MILALLLFIDHVFIHITITPNTHHLCTRHFYRILYFCLVHLILWYSDVVFNHLYCVCVHLCCIFLLFLPTHYAQKTAPTVHLVCFPTSVLLFFPFSPILLPSSIFKNENRHTGCETCSVGGIYPYSGSLFFLLYYINMVGGAY